MILFLLESGKKKAGTSAEVPARSSFSLAEAKSANVILPNAEAGFHFVG